MKLKAAICSLQQTMQTHNDDTVQGSKLTGVLLPGACKIWLGQLKSSGQLPQWATGFLHAGQLLELGSNNKNNNLNHLEIIKKTENQEKLSFLYVAKQ